MKIEMKYKFNDEILSFCLFPKKNYLRDETVKHANKFESTKYDYIG